MYVWYVRRQDYVFRRLFVSFCAFSPGAASSLPLVAVPDAVADAAAHSLAGDPVAQVEQTRGVVQQPDPLLLLPLLRHLVPEVGQLRGEGLDQVLCSLQLVVERPPLVLLALHLLNRQGDGTQPGEPLQAALLKLSQR